MFQFVKTTLIALLVLTFGTTIFAQETLDETFDNGAFAFDYPFGWVPDAFMGAYEDGTPKPVIFLYSSTKLAEMVIGGRDAADLPQGEAVIYLASNDDGKLTVRAAMDALVAQEKSGGTEVGSVRETATIGYEGYIASYDTGTSEGFIGVLGNQQLRITFIMLAATGDLTKYEETFKVVLNSIRPSERNAGSQSDETTGASDRLKQLPKDDTDPSTTLAYGMSVTDVLVNRSGDEWTFEGRKGDIISILMTSLALDSYLELYDPKGGLIEENDDGGGGLNALIEGVQLKEDGIYTIVARTFASQRRGNYTLVLIEGKEFGGLIVGTIEVGDNIAGTLPPGIEQIYTFVGKAGDQVTIELRSDDLTMDPYLELRSPDGALLAEDDDSGGNLNAQIENFELPQNGEYQIVVRTLAGFGGGDYILTLR